MNNEPKTPNVQRKDMTGQRCGLLVVLAYAGYDRRTGQALWRCRCDCRKETVVSGKHLRQGKTRSCGCLMLKRYGKAVDNA